MIPRHSRTAIRFLATAKTLCFHPHHAPGSFALFSSTGRSRADNVNHYQVLNLAPNCTPAELKKQFYTLSRQTHPDINPNDPTASQRFSQISESYSILANPEKRRRYDRDTLQRQQQNTSSSRYSEHKGSYAGSRPASGLSKRPGAFRGPPPSFYAHGGSKTNSSTDANAGPTAGVETAGSGGFNAFTNSNNKNSNGDFDPSSVFKTQTHEDTRRHSRRAAAMERAQADMEDDGSFWIRFIVVTGMILGTVSLGTIFVGMGEHNGGLVRGDGSRRSAAPNAWTKG